MNNRDIIQRFIFANANVRGELVHLTQSFQTIISQHPYPPAMQKIVGEALLVASLLSAIIKFKGRLTVQFQGKDPLKLLLAQCNHEFKLRGLAQWRGDLSEEDIIAILKSGTLAIMISPDTSTKPYQGIVTWQGNSFAQSVEGYFTHSEQLPTRLWLAVNDKMAAGLLVQMMPKEGMKITQPVTSNDDWEHILHLTQTITPDELLSLDHSTLLRRLYSQEDVELFQPIPIQFGCTCSIERSKNMVLMLGKEEAERELQDKQTLVVTCEFCNKEYVFGREDVLTIFKQIH